MKIILFVATIISVINCYAQDNKKVIDKDFKSLLNKYTTIRVPINYKKINNLSEDMTKEEAIQFFHKTEDNLMWTVTDIGEDEVIYTSEEEYVPGCKFKYQLNDSIYVLCTIEQSGIAIEDSTWVILHSFSQKGIIIDCHIVGGEFARNNKIASFVLFDKNHIRVFYYNNDYTRQNDGYLSTVYYVNYEITNDGKFIEKDKSDITYLKDFAIKYSTYKPQSDDPMNEYDF